MLSVLSLNTVRDGSQSRRKKFAITALAAAVFALPSMMRSAILYPVSVTVSMFGQARVIVAVFSSD